MDETTVEWGVRTVATPPGTVLPATRIHACLSEQQADGLLSYYRGLYANRSKLNGTADIVTRHVGPWQEADHG